jgi:hypothetical protein
MYPPSSGMSIFVSGVAFTVSVALWPSGQAWKYEVFEPVVSAIFWKWARLGCVGCWEGSFDQPLISSVKVSSPIAFAMA